MCSVFARNACRGYVVMSLNTVDDHCKVVFFISLALSVPIICQDSSISCFKLQHVSDPYLVAEKDIDKIWILNMDDQVLVIRESKIKGERNWDNGEAQKRITKNVFVFARQVIRYFMVAGD